MIWVKVGSEAKAGGPKDVLPAASWILALVPSVHRRSRACITMVTCMPPMGRWCLAMVTCMLPMGYAGDKLENACEAKRS